MDEDDHMDDDWDTTRTQQTGDLLDDDEEPHTSSGDSHRHSGENNDNSCGSGKMALLTV